MRKPAVPPDFHKTFLEDPNFFERIHPIMRGIDFDERYLHWDKVRRMSAPEGFTPLDCWAAIKVGRLATLKRIALAGCDGKLFAFCSPGIVAKLLHEIDMSAGGKIGIPAEVRNPETRDQYLVNSLMEEAITSSQLEGAATTRAVAKDMLRTGRKPRNTGERMIVNNYLTMRQIRELRERPLSEELVFAVHRSVTADTLGEEGAAGRYRRADEPVTVAGPTGEVLHWPPAAGELPARMAAMCAFCQRGDAKLFCAPGSARDHPTFLACL